VLVAFNATVSRAGGHPLNGRHLAPAESTFGSWRGTLGGLTRAAALRELCGASRRSPPEFGDLDRTAPSARERGGLQGRHPPRPIRHTQRESGTPWALPWRQESAYAAGQAARGHRNVAGWLVTKVPPPGYSGPRRSMAAALSARPMAAPDPCVSHGRPHACLTPCVRSTHADPMHSRDPWKRQTYRASAATGPTYHDPRPMRRHEAPSCPWERPGRPERMGRERSLRRPQSASNPPDELPMVASHPS
jgi:hypothetical protein